MLYLIFFFANGFVYLVIFIRDQFSILLHYNIIKRACDYQWNVMNTWEKTISHLVPPATFEQWLATKAHCSSLNNHIYINHHLESGSHLYPPLYWHRTPIIIVPLTSFQELEKLYMPSKWVCRIRPEDVLDDHINTIGQGKLCTKLVRESHRKKYIMLIWASDIVEGRRSTFNCSLLFQNHSLLYHLHYCNWITASTSLNWESGKMFPKIIYYLICSHLTFSIFLLLSHSK